MSYRSAPPSGKTSDTTMRMIHGHIESVINRPTIPLSLVVRARTSLGTDRLECVIGTNSRINRGSTRLSVEELRVGEYVVATLRVHAGWLEAEQIDVIKLGIDSAIGLSGEDIPTQGADRIA